ncbi:V/A-type H+-transporting ATPase subunit D [Roseibium hamelinense]|uniref:V/A-type H+-transporting ATPase subunit D n=1 Tax=Roseibium hamelinense TaxID=150831 RepID=A0A562SY90_9HYPH|nr:V-type ATP synthase subunit D [Roseibium hamelinense]MTI44877.1 V-type ATP synthase subunit D [Roseibium hamelinense]TWI85928.1 V/A-type H+-transporting ATPase subunit D [Roseibium hamelinense]
MAKLALNKSSLARETSHLAEYRRFLPSLELKRLQIVAERAKAKTLVAELDAAFERRFAEIAHGVPMLANTQVPVEGLVKITHVEIGEQNLSGTRLPFVSDVEIDIDDYSQMGRPHWVDPVVTGLQELIKLDMERRVAHDRVSKLIEAEAVISRRVNLFEKVLIPQAEKNIKKIRMALADAERDAVVRAKISKRKTAARAAGQRMAEL